MGTPAPSERGAQQLKGLRLFATAALLTIACESVPPKTPNVDATVEARVRATMTTLASQPKPTEPPRPTQPTERPPTPVPASTLPPPTQVPSRAPTATVSQVERVSDADFITFRSPYLRYQMLYPRTWTTTSRNQPSLYDHFGDEGAGVIVRADPTGTTSIDGHRVNVVQDKFYGVTITSEKRRKMGPYDAIHFVGRQFFDPSVGTLHYEEVIFIARERGWRISMAAQPQLAAKSAAQFQKMLDSFRLL